MRKVSKLKKNTNPNKNGFEFYKKMRHTFKSDYRGVSEAIGTILLLSISIALVGVVTYWVQMLPEAEEVINSKFDGSLVIEGGNHIVKLKHMGGDRLDVLTTDLHVKINSITTVFPLHESTLAEFDNGYWEVGEEWEQDIESLHSWGSLPEVIIEIIDINSDAIISKKFIQQQGTAGDLPDLSVSEEDINFRYFNTTVSRGDWINISARIHNLGDSDAANVIVRFFDGSEIISNNNKDYVFINLLSVSTYETVYVNWTPDYSGLNTISVKIYSVQIEDDYTNNHASKEFMIEPIMPYITGPNFEVEGIDFSPESPTHGNWVSISVLVKNVGDEIIPKGTTINLTLWDEKGYLITKGTTINQSTTLTSNLTIYETLLPPFTHNDQTTSGGTTIIWAEITSSISESRSDDNRLYRSIQILPNILLVDDDATYDRYTQIDTSSYMDASLQLAVGSGQFDIWTVKGIDGPKFDSGDKPLQNYDIVIWMTGYQTTNTLTASDIIALQKYLDNGGNLWLIGMNILDDLGAPTSFTNDYLGVNGYSVTGTPELLYGVSGEVITDGMVLNTSNMVEPLDRGTILTLRNSVVGEHTIDGILGNDKELGVNQNISLKYYNETKDFKVVYFGWEFASIIDMVDRNNLTIQILKWFGWQLEIGTDLAIASTGFSNENPNFMDWITISARVRNNGPRDLSRIRVDFFLVDSDGVESRIPEYPGFENSTNPMFIYISGDGGEYEVSKKWLAITVGQHRFRVVVDLEDEIEEVSEENNDDLYSPLFVTQLFIGYTILVVDDDNSTNNGGNELNATIDITNSLDELGYIYDFYATTGGLTPQSGPDIDLMKHYNTVIWCTGYDRNATLLTNDFENLGYYFTRSNFTEADFLEETKFNTWIVGQGILDDLHGTGLDVNTPVDSFAYNYLRVQKYSTIGSQLPTYLDGVEGDNITHGISYPTIQSGMDQADIITPLSDAEGIFWQNDNQTSYNALSHSTLIHNLVFTPWSFSLIDDSLTMGLVNESNKDELTYLTMSLFSYPDERFELKTSTIDIKLSSYNPVLSDSYIIKTNVFNLGNNDTNAVVRFLDGNTIIDTKSIFIPAKGNSSTEVIWSPLYAGYRDIRVSVDPEDDIDEVFDVLNNNASLSNQPVYFFYDDMENGSSNWDHESNIILINGESPLDYMDNPVYINVNGTWDHNMSQRFDLNATDYHSYNFSYHASEPVGLPYKATLDVVLALDTSGSMSGQKLTDLKAAAVNFVNHEMLDARDRLAIYGFDTSENPDRKQDFTECDSSGKTSLISTINGLSASGYTPLWDTIGAAVNYASTSGSSRLPIVIAMTDGEDYGTGGSEDGSETYCPWHNWSDGEKDYTNIGGSGGQDHAGCYGGSTTSEGSWEWADLQDETRYGLLNITMMSVYTVGLGLEHDNHTGDSSWRFPNGWMGEYVEYELGALYNTSVYNESGTPEFNLWRVADTSGADYFYADQSSQLNNIFQVIAADIVAETAVQRSGKDLDDDNGDEHGTPRARATIHSAGFETDWDGWAHTGDEDEWERGDPSEPDIAPHTGSFCAVTDLDNDYEEDANNYLYQTFDLSGYTDCELTFWHFLEARDRRDGCCVMVSDNGGTSWSLAEPDLPSTNWKTNMRNDYENKLGHDSGWTRDVDPWEKVTIDLSTYDNEEIIIRFWFASDNNERDGWAIDDIEITGTSSGPGPGPGPGPEPDWEPGDRNLTTYPFSLMDVSTAKISFYHKYNLRNGLNGVVVMVGTTDDPMSNNYTFEYARPTQPYTNNLLVSRNWYDDYGNRMRWCWNGISGNGKFTWDYVEVDLTNWTGQKNIRVRIAFLWASAGDGGGYFIDDFKITANRNESIPLSANSVDQWELTNSYSRSGSSCWWNHNLTTKHLTGGLDNSLYTRPIDLTNARNATLSAYFKFNINTESGRPPDGFRIEISEDNGITWKAINMGVRTAWGVSTNGTDIDDGVTDGKSYSGLDVTATDPSSDGWVEASTLTRLNTDISGWSSSVIILRFRVVTASNDNPYFGGNHYEWSNPTNDAYGFMMDDVIIYGFSLLN